MVCKPAPFSVTPDNAATPAKSVTGLPPLSNTTVDPTVSVNVTPPVGTVAVWPAVVSVTPAVMVSGCPIFAAAGFVDTATAVVSPGLRPVPLTATLCVALLTLRLLLVAMMLALRTPTDCGVNCTDRAQIVPAASDVLERHWLLAPVG